MDVWLGILIGIAVTLAGLWVWRLLLDWEDAMRLDGLGRDDIEDDPSRLS